MKINFLKFAIFTLVSGNFWTTKEGSKAYLELLALLGESNDLLDAFYEDLNMKNNWKRKLKANAERMIVNFNRCGSTTEQASR